MAKRSGEDVKVTDRETAIQVLVARAVYWGDYNGYISDVERALMGIGLSEYIHTRDNVFKVNMSKIHEAIGETMEVRIAKASGATPDLTNELSGKIYEKALAVSRKMTEGDWTLQDAPSKLVDVPATVKIFGRDGDLPPTEGDDAEQVWRELVTAVLAWGEDQGVCGALETALRSLGFERFMPPSEVTVNVTWHGAVIPVTISTNRRGEPKVEMVYDAMRRKLRDEWQTAKMTVCEPDTKVADAA